MQRVHEVIEGEGSCCLQPSPPPEMLKTYIKQHLVYVLDKSGSDQLKD